MRNIMNIHVVLDESREVNGVNASACMIMFHGYVESELFTGKICPGGVDTQLQNSGEVRSLSARYILTGTDYTGATCSIFIENNGVVADDGIVTTPRIITDSVALAWLETARLVGHVVSEKTGICIVIEEEEQNE